MNRLKILQKAIKIVELSDNCKAKTNCIKHTLKNPYLLSKHRRELEDQVLLLEKAQKRIEIYYQNHIKLIK